MLYTVAKIHKVTVFLNMHTKYKTNCCIKVKSEIKSSDLPSPDIIKTICLWAILSALNSILWTMCSNVPKAKGYAY